MAIVRASPRRTKLLQQHRKATSTRPNSRLSIIPWLLLLLMLWLLIITVWRCSDKIVSLLHVDLLDQTTIVSATQWKSLTSASLTTTTKNATTAATTAVPLPPPPPAACTAHQLATIEYQLPAEQCVQNAKVPFWGGGACSFSWATRCPEPHWLLESPSSSSSVPPPPTTAVYVGCNKGMDAINTLRRLSNDPTIDKHVWTRAFVANLPMASTGSGHFTANTNVALMETGRCRQDRSDQWAIRSSSSTPTSAHVYCIEAMPSTAQHLQATAQRLGYDGPRGFHVVHAAMGEKDGRTRFPSLTQVGVEDKGLGDCHDDVPDDHRRDEDGCELVPLYTLDTFVHEHMIPQQDDKNDDGMIDLLSIDVEGYDWPVLLGGAQTLARRVRYLEFEYNWKGAWKNTSFSDVITTLHQQHGFTCYWAGAHGQLWRITDCFLPHYEHHYWSNVACVHRVLAVDLAHRMEDLFLETLQAGRSIRYDHEMKT